MYTDALASLTQHLYLPLVQLMALLKASAVTYSPSILPLVQLMAFLKASAVTYSPSILPLVQLMAFLKASAVTYSPSILPPSRKKGLCVTLSVSLFSNELIEDPRLVLCRLFSQIYRHVHITYIYIYIYTNSLLHPLSIRAQVCLNINQKYG